MKGCEKCVLRQLVRKAYQCSSRVGKCGEASPRQRAETGASQRGPVYCNQRCNCALTCPDRAGRGGRCRSRSTARCSAKASARAGARAGRARCRAAPGRRRAAVLQVAAACAMAGGDRVAAHAVGQRQRAAAVGAAREAIAALPVLVEQVAVAQVGDAGAAQLAQARERRRVGRGAEQQVDPVAAALERRAVVRRAEEDEVVEARRPALAGLRAVVQALRATRPPMLWPSITQRSTGTGQASQQRARAAAPARARWSRRAGRCCSAGRPA